MCPPVAPSISCAVIRTLPPALRTLPSTTWLTLSWRATCGTSTCLPLNMKAVLRAATQSADTLDRSVMMSSLIPSEKYSCSGSPLMLANGRPALFRHSARLDLRLGGLAHDVDMHRALQVLDGVLAHVLEPVRHLARHVVPD